MNANQIIEKVVYLLKNVRGIDAIVLGGSRARGNFTSKSDIDIGIYYSNGDELDLRDLRIKAWELDDKKRADIITGTGEWGPWINGGGWLTIDGIATDFLFRDINKVRGVIDDCLNGKITIDYQPGHPHGFPNTIYLAETYYCKVLWDPGNVIAKLKEKVTPYPEAIKRGVLTKFLWEAGFSAAIAEKGLAKRDLVYISGCLYRAVSCLIQVIFALNERFIMNEKGAIAEMKEFRVAPCDFAMRAEELFTNLSVDPDQLKEKIDRLKAIIGETEELCNS